MNIIKKIYKKIMLKLFSPVINKILSDKAETQPEYLQLIERAYKKGYEYHQKEVQRNPELLKWTLKDNYFN